MYKKSNRTHSKKRNSHKRDKDRFLERETNAINNLLIKMLEMYSHFAGYVYN